MYGFSWSHRGGLKARPFPPPVSAHQVHSQYLMVMWAVSTSRVSPPGPLSLGSSTGSVTGRGTLSEGCGNLGLDCDVVHAASSLAPGSRLLDAPFAPTPIPPPPRPFRVNATGAPTASFKNFRMPPTACPYICAAFRCTPDAENPAPAPFPGGACVEAPLSSRLEQLCATRCKPTSIPRSAFLRSVWRAPQPPTKIGES